MAGDGVYSFGDPSPYIKGIRTAQSVGHEKASAAPTYVAPPPVAVTPFSTNTNIDLTKVKQAVSGDSKSPGHSKVLLYVGIGAAALAGYFFFLRKRRA